MNGDVPTAKLRAQMLAAVPAFRTILSIFPLPTAAVSPTADSGRFEGVGPIKAWDNHAVVKTDVRIADRMAAAFTYTRGRPYRYVASYTANAQDWQGYQERGTANFTMSGATWTSETRFGYNFNEVDRNQAYWFTAVDPDRPESSYGSRRLPTVTVPGLFSSGAEFNNRYGPLWSLEEKYAIHAGKHSFKFEGIVTRRGSGRVNIETPNLQYTNVAGSEPGTAVLGTFTFNSTTTAPFDQLTTIPYRDFDSPRSMDRLRLDPTSKENSSYQMATRLSRRASARGLTMSSLSSLACEMNA